MNLTRPNDYPATDMVVTRHPALVALLRERGEVGPDIVVVGHVADPATLRGRRVWGVLPLHLAALAEEVCEVPLDLTPDMRGRELALDELRAVAGLTRRYRVTEVTL